MSTETRSRIRTPYAAALDLPPPFRLVTLREVGDAFAHATAIASEAGGGGAVARGWAGGGGGGRGGGRPLGSGGVARGGGRGGPREGPPAPLLRRHGGACRRASGACAAREADRLRLARRGVRRRRAGGRRP